MEASDLAVCSDHLLGYRRVFPKSGTMAPIDKPVSPPHNSSPARKMKKKRFRQRDRRDESSSKQKNKLSIAGLLFGSYLAIVAAFLLQFVIHPSRFKQLITQSSLATTIKNVDPLTVLAPDQVAKDYLSVTTTTPRANEPERPKRAEPGKETDNVNFTIYDGIVQGRPFRYCNVGDQNTVAGRSSRDIVVLDVTSSRSYNPGEGQFSEQVVWEMCGSGKRRDHIRSIIWLELGGMAEPDDIMRLFQSLRVLNILSQLPVSTIVTGKDATRIIMDWILHGNVETLTQQVAQHWVPVHAQSVLQTELLEETTIDGASVNVYTAPLQAIRDWPILVMHGSEDAVGKSIAAVLESQASATVVEVPGGPAYFEEDPPVGSRIFAHAVYDFLEPPYDNAPHSLDHLEDAQDKDVVVSLWSGDLG